jgi:hypothetical protein
VVGLELTMVTTGAYKPPRTPAGSTLLEVGIELDAPGSPAAKHTPHAGRLHRTISVNKSGSRVDLAAPASPGACDSPWSWVREGESRGSAGSPSQRTLSEGSMDPSIQASLADRARAELLAGQSRLRRCAVAVNKSVVYQASSRGRVCHEVPISTERAHRYMRSQLLLSTSS